MMYRKRLYDGKPMAKPKPWQCRTESLGIASPRILVPNSRQCSLSAHDFFHLHQEICSRLFMRSAISTYPFA